MANVEQVLLGKTFVVRLGFVALFSEGHLLLEDFPGTGKTSLARAIGQSVAGTSNRIQFTPDLLPGDITGVSVYDQRTGEFDFHAGRCSPTSCSPTRSTGRARRPRPRCSRSWKRGRSPSTARRTPSSAPFMVIATQNPIEQAGTYRLPEAQLDRFLLKASIGYPDHASTLRILEGAGVKAHETTVAADRHRRRRARDGPAGAHRACGPERQRLRVAARGVPPAAPPRCGSA